MGVGAEGSDGRVERAGRPMIGIGGRLDVVSNQRYM